MAMEQGLYNRQELALKQEQTLAPQQIQSLEILLAPLMDLEVRVNQELAENPALERLDSEGELAGDPVEDLSSETNNEELAAEVAERDEFLANLMQLDQGWQDYLPPGHARRQATSDDEERRQYFFDSLTSETSLQDELLTQLRTTVSDPEIFELAQQIVGNIDEAGYLRANIKDLAQVSGAALEDMEAALALVQGCEPAGIGARDLRECLLLQLERRGRQDSLAYKLADRFLDKLARNRIPDVARVLDVTPAQLYEAWDEIRELRPRPGGLLGSDQVHYVAPEVTIEEDEGSYVVSSNKTCVPHLRISRLYRQLLRSPDTPAEVREYVKQKVLSGNQLIKSIEQRRSTIHRIAERLVEHQRDFFDKGPEYMRPLTMGEIAEEIGVHETTVSRAIAGKYVQTPRGLFPLRHFFSGGYETDDGEELAAISVKEKLRQIIGEEDPHKPLSDQKLVKLLGDQGVDVARRTVAKYREEMNIPSSHRRKIHGKG